MFLILQFHFTGARVTVHLPGPGLLPIYRGQDYCPFTAARVTAHLPGPGLLPIYWGQDYRPFSGARIIAHLPGPGLPPGAHLQSSYRGRGYSPVTRSRITAHLPGPGLPPIYWDQLLGPELLPIYRRAPGLPPIYRDQLPGARITGARITVQLPGSGLQSSYQDCCPSTRARITTHLPRPITMSQDYRGQDYSLSLVTGARVTVHFMRLLWQILLRQAYPCARCRFSRRSRGMPGVVMADIVHKLV